MSPARLRFVLTVIGAGAVALALVVLIRNRSPDDEMLAALGLLGGIAIIVVAAAGNRDG